MGNLNDVNVQIYREIFHLRIGPSEFAIKVEFIGWRMLKMIFNDPRK